KNSAMTSDAAESLLMILFNYGDQRVVPIAHDILNRKIRIAGPVLALLRLEGAKHLEKVYALLGSDDNYYRGLEIVESMDAQYADDKILRAVLNGFASHRNKQDYVADRIVRDFIKLNAVKYISNVGNYVTDAETVQMITKAYGLQKVSMDEVLAYLLQTG